MGDIAPLDRYRSATLCPSAMDRATGCPAQCAAGQEGGQTARNPASTHRPFSECDGSTSLCLSVTERNTEGQVQSATGKQSGVKPPHSKRNPFALHARLPVRETRDVESDCVVRLNSVRVLHADWLPIQASGLQDSFCFSPSRRSRIQSRSRLRHCCARSAVA